MKLEIEWEIFLIFGEIVCGKKVIFFFFLKDRS